MKFTLPPRVWISVSLRIVFQFRALCQKSPIFCSFVRADRWCYGHFTVFSCNKLRQKIHRWQMEAFSLPSSTPVQTFSKCTQTWQILGRSMDTNLNNSYLMLPNIQNPEPFLSCCSGGGMDWSKAAPTTSTQLWEWAQTGLIQEENLVGFVSFLIIWLIPAVSSMHVNDRFMKLAGT